LSKEQSKEIAIPKEAVETLRQIHSNLVKLQSDFQIYAGGVKAGLGLNGEYYLNAEKWVFLKVEKTEKENGGG